MTGLQLNLAVAAERVVAENKKLKLGAVCQ
jgi:hypothetical protein